MMVAITKIINWIKLFRDASGVLELLKSIISIIYKALKFFYEALKGKDQKFVHRKESNNGHNDKGNKFVHSKRDKYDRESKFVKKKA